MASKLSSSHPSKTSYTKSASSYAPTGINAATTLDRIRQYQAGLQSGFAGTSIMPSFGGSLDDYFKRIQQLTQQNNLWSAQQAQKQMDFQQSSADKAMQFESDQADINRKWQEMMSNTAHQREVKDLQAAGLNPVLSATGGQGAPVTSGATASGSSGQGAKGDTDTSGASAMVGLISSMLQSQTALLSQSMSAQTALATADKYTAASRFAAQLSANSGRYAADMSYKQGVDVAGINRGTQFGVANINRGTQIAVAGINMQSNITSSQIHAAATQAAAKISGEYHLSASRQSALASIINSSISAAASRYGTDVRSWTDQEIAKANRDLQLELQQRGYDFDVSLQTDKFKNMFKLMFGKELVDGTGGAILAGLRDILASIAGASGSYWSGSARSPLVVPRIGP